MTIPTATAHQRGRRTLWAALLLGALLFVPGALGFLFDASSFAPGTAIVVLAALALAVSGEVPLKGRDVQRALVIAGVAAFAIVAHLIMAVAIINDPDVDISRALLSLLLLVAIVVSVPAVRESVMNDQANISRSGKIVCIIFLVISAFSILQIQPETTSLGTKPIFPYTEPSFLGFSIPAVLLLTASRSGLIMRVVWIFLFLIIGYWLANFTIIATCVLVAATVLPISWFFGGLVVAVIGSTSLDLSYYTDRLDFDWANSKNISALVYVQGWQLLLEAIHKSYGWGLGFQQLGIGYTNVPATAKINLLLGRDANLQDGGFILSKIVSEFGIFGFFLVIGYIYFAARSFLKIRRASRAGIYVSDAELFARCCVLGYVIEGIVRGTNYFTGTFVLLLAGLAYLVLPRTDISQIGER